VNTTASVSIQPTRNAGPFTFARDENSRRITAAIERRLIATAIPYVSTSAMPWPMVAFKIRINPTDAPMRDERSQSQTIP